MTAADPHPTPQPEPPAHPDQDTPQTAVALLRQLGLTHAPAANACADDTRWRWAVVYGQ